MLLNALICLSSLLVIVSKFLDCYTTDRVVREIRQERNPLARWLMQRLGMRFTIWGIFVLTVLLVIAALYMLYGDDPSILYKLAYIAIALFSSGAQAAVAHTNATGRLNVFTRFLLRRWGL